MRRSGAAEILREAGRAAGLPGPGAVAAQAFELSLDPPSAGLVIGVSHEGGTAATNAAMAAARAAGARTALLTVSSRSPGAAEADRPWSSRPTNSTRAGATRSAT